MEPRSDWESRSGSASTNASSQRSSSQHRSDSSRQAARLQQFSDDPLLAELRHLDASSIPECSYDELMNELAGIVAQVNRSNRTMREIKQTLRWCEEEIATEAATTHALSAAANDLKLTSANLLNTAKPLLPKIHGRR